MNRPSLWKRVVAGTFGIELRRPTLCDPTPAVETVALAGKWQPRDDAEYDRRPADDDVPPMLLLARMRDRLKTLRHELLELRADRAALEQANDRLIAQRNAKALEADSLRTALTAVGRELDDTRAHVAVLTRELAATPMRMADAGLLIQPLPGVNGELS